MQRMNLSSERLFNRIYLSAKVVNVKDGHCFDCLNQLNLDQIVQIKSVGSAALNLYSERLFAGSTESLCVVNVKDGHCFNCLNKINSSCLN